MNEPLSLEKFSGLDFFFEGLWAPFDVSLWWFVPLVVTVLIGSIVKECESESRVSSHGDFVVTVTSFIGALIFFSVISILSATPLFNPVEQQDMLKTLDVVKSASVDSLNPWLILAGVSCIAWGIYLIAPLKSKSDNLVKDWPWASICAFLLAIVLAFSMPFELKELGEMLSLIQTEANLRIGGWLVFSYMLGLSLSFSVLSSGVWFFSRAGLLQKSLWVYAGTLMSVVCGLTLLWQAI